MHGVAVVFLEVADMYLTICSRQMQREVFVRDESSVNSIGDSIM
jgi:hypothetical protein